MMYVVPVERKKAAGGMRAGGLGIAFLLSQLGAHAAARFADRLAALRLTPGQAGLLRMVAKEPGLNQRQLADRLRAQPSRVVALVDELQERGLLARRTREGDRRSHTIELTEDGRRALMAIREIAEAHEAEITGALSHEERVELAFLMQRLAAAHALEPGVHPGYRSTSP